MPTVAEHYESHLAPIYVWMAGGSAAAIARGRAEVEEVCPRPASPQWAVDLGAGFGMHAIPLAELGYSVLAIDSSRMLLDLITNHTSPGAIRAVHDDLRSFTRHLPGPAALIVCMGDTLTHLSDRSSVERLLREVADALMPGGVFVVSFRDYMTALVGTQRFVPVRSDSDRILTCFLEYEEDTVMVHDVLHEREGAGWQQRVSAYRKLRLSPAWVTEVLEVAGLRVRRERGLAGMIRLVAERPVRRNGAQ